MGTLGVWKLKFFSSQNSIFLFNVFFFFKFNEQLRALQLASYKLTFASSVGGGDIAKLRQLPDLLFSLGVPILRVDLLLIFLKYKKSKL